jgi:hypothetical protein
MQDDKNGDDQEIRKGQPGDDLDDRAGAPGTKSQGYS